LKSTFIDPGGRIENTLPIGRRSIRPLTRSAEAILRRASNTEIKMMKSMISCLGDVP